MLYINEDQCCPLCGAFMERVNDESGTCASGHWVPITNYVSLQDYDSAWYHTRVIIEAGIHVEDWACDMNREGDIQTNGGVEHIKYFEGEMYSIITDFSDENDPYFPVYEPIEKGMYTKTMEEFVAKEKDLGFEF